MAWSGREVSIALRVNIRKMVLFTLTDSACTTSVIHSPSWPELDGLLSVSSPCDALSDHQGSPQPRKTRSRPPCRESAPLNQRMRSLWPPSAEPAPPVRAEKLPKGCAPPSRDIFGIWRGEGVGRLSGSPEVAKRKTADTGPGSSATHHGPWRLPPAPRGQEAGGCLPLDLAPPPRGTSRRKERQGGPGGHPAGWGGTGMSWHQSAAAKPEGESNNLRESEGGRPFMEADSGQQDARKPVAGVGAEPMVPSGPRVAPDSLQPHCGLSSWAHPHPHPLLSHAFQSNAITAS